MHLFIMMAIKCDVIKSDSQHVIHLLQVYYKLVSSCPLLMRQIINYGIILGVKIPELLLMKLQSL